MHLFYQPDLQPEAPSLFLTEEDARHAVKVLRLSKGEVVLLTNGQGLFCKARITEPNQKATQLQALESWQEPEPGFHIHLCIAPTKNADRMEWMVEKCMEFGIHAISLLVTHHSERRVFKLERLEKIAISALKQSQQGFLPAITGPVTWSDFLKAPVFSGQKFMASMQARPQDHLFRLARPHGRYQVLVGPEGDFSPTETEEAMAAGFQKITLGPTRLRTETAGLAVCQILNLIQQISTHETH
jgi:16S rRNA (uracil1498-N3)-methyltransferase